MKKTILFLLFAVFCFTSYAQTDKEFDNMLKSIIIEGMVDAILGVEPVEPPPPPPPTYYQSGSTYGPRSGSIHFTNGNYVRFTNIIRVHEEPFRNSDGLRAQHEGLYVYFQDSYRTVPYENIRTFQIFPERIYNYFVSGSMEVTTKNGIRFSTPVSIIDIDVTIYDALTGGMMEQNFRFATFDRLLISWIEFD